MTSNTTEQRTAALAELVERVRGTVRRELSPEETGARVATDLVPFLGRTDLLTEAQMEADAEQYRQHVLHVEPDGSFSVVSLVWLPTQRTPIHDHVSWCVVGVHVGEETEVRYEVHVDGEERYMTCEETSVNHHRSVCAVVPPGDIHEVRNTGDDKAISIHVYGADISRLGSSIRRRYDLPVREQAS
jgi:predicted metal-dependent enzyme (double-stranded beta helix superfamily)